MSAFTPFESLLVHLPADNIDTDQIIPARFLKTTTKEGLGAQCFHDWRFHGDGALKTDFPLNRPEARGRRILVAGDNFGCGSSREHAPWALMDFGIPCYGFAPLRLDADMPFLSLFHGHDERVPVSALEFGLPVLADVVARYTLRDG